MVGFGLLLVDFGALVGEVPYFFQLMDLNGALSLVDLMSKFRSLTAQAALYSSSTGR